jgi:hypothetical protein
VTQAEVVEQVSPTEAALTGEFEAKVSDTLPDHHRGKFTWEGFQRLVQRSGSVVARFPSYSVMTSAAPPIRSA